MGDNNQNVSQNISKWVYFYEKLNIARFNLKLNATKNDNPHVFCQSVVRLILILTRNANTVNVRFSARISTLKRKIHTRMNRFKIYSLSNIRFISFLLNHLICHFESSIIQSLCVHSYVFIATLTWANKCSKFRITFIKYTMTNGSTIWMFNVHWPMTINICISRYWYTVHANCAVWKGAIVVCIPLDLFIVCVCL